MKKNIWLILIMIPWVLNAQLTNRLEVGRSEIVVVQQDGFDRVQFGNCYTDKIGQPELPVVKRAFVIPTNAVVDVLKVTESGRSRIDGNYKVYPVQPLKTSGWEDAQTFVYQDSVYQSAMDLPGDTAVISFDGIVRGYHVVIISYYPLVYVPAKSELYLRNIEVSVSYSMGNSVESQGPISFYRANLAKKYVQSMVENPSDVERFSDDFNVIQERSCLNPKIQDSKQRSVYSFQEIIPDYIIITSDSLRESFQKLADWKTKKGIPTIIQSVEEINIEYPGGDLQEKIRNYLLNVRKRWNADGMYILFGGDVNVIPVRTYQHEGTQATDGYYVANSVSWSPTYGGISLSGVTPFNSGRIPVKNKKEADNFIRKIISYEKASETGVNYNYLNNSLIVDAFMYKCGTKPCEGYMKMVYDYCQGRPANFWYMFDHFNCKKDDHILEGNYHAERGVELNRANLLSALKNDKIAINELFHFVYHMDHSVPTVLGSSSKDKEESLAINEVEGAAFRPKYYQVIMSGSCHPADFSKDCIAEHLLNKVDAGVVAFIGNTDVGHYDSEEAQLDSLYKYLYTTNPSVCGQFSLGYLRLKAVKNADEEKRLHLLGDPEMPLWTRNPTDLSVAVTPTYMQNGTNDILVSVSGIPQNQQAMICLKKDNEGYATKIVDRDGTYKFTFTPITAGKIDVTVTSHDCRPFETQLTVGGMSPSVRISEISFNDDNIGEGIGNGDGRLDAGETVKMKITIQNCGLNALNIPSGSLSCTSKHISLLGNRLNFGIINPGKTLTSTNEVSFRINEDIGATQVLRNDMNADRFDLVMNDQYGKAHVDTFKIDIYAPELELREQRVTGDLAPESTNGLYVSLMNVGKSVTDSLTAVLSIDGSESHVDSFQADSSRYQSIGLKETSENVLPFFFRTDNQYSETNNSLKMSLEVKNRYGRVWKFPINPNNKGAVIPGNSLKCLSQDKNIELYWISNSGKYNLYRSDTGINGVYWKLNLYPLTSAYYKDEQILQGKIYYYKLAAISTSGNEGPMSSPLKAWASLPLMKGFPKYFPNSRNIQGSVCVADVDYDGKKELFYTQRNFDKGHDGFLMGFRHTGEELFDIDNNPSTISGFAQLSATVWATPVIGDLLGDGEQKIIAVTRNEDAGTTLNSVTCFAARDNDSNNRPDEIWRRQPEGQFYRGAVVSNLDNSSDGSMEVVLRSNDYGQPIRITDANGNERYSFGNGGLSMPAVADLDGDGDKEIIVGYDDGIYIWHHNGTPFTKNPFFTQEGYWCGSSPVICDLNKDGKKEILFTAKKIETNGLVTSMVCVLKTDGTKLPGWSGTQSVPFNFEKMPNELSVGDINLDGKPEVILLGIDMLKVWKSDGTLLFTRNIDLPKPTKISAAIADVNGDAYPEIVFGSKERVYAFDRMGNEVMGFPLVTDYSFVASVYVGDINNDGKSELVAVDDGNIYAWKTNGNPNAIEWGSERHDPQNTGEYGKICEPKLILSSQTWNSVDPCGNVIIQRGTLTISGKILSLTDKTSKIIVRPGASLVIDGGIISNAYIRALPGARVILKNGGKISLRDGGKMTIDNGAIFSNQGGRIETLY